MEAYTFSGPRSPDMGDGELREGVQGTFCMSHMHAADDEHQPTFRGIQFIGSYIGSAAYKNTFSELRDIIWEEGSEVRFAAPVLQRGWRELLYVITPYRLIH